MIAQLLWAGKGNIHVTEVALQQEKKALLLLQRGGAGDDDGSVNVRAHATRDDGENIVGMAKLIVAAKLKSKQQIEQAGSTGIYCWAAHDILFSKEREFVALSGDGMVTDVIMP